MLGKRLKELREERKYLQIDIANMLGVSRSTYTQYETGKSEPDFSTVSKLTEIFNVSMDYLFGKTDIRNYDDIETIAAHHDGEDWSEEELADIEKFKEFVRMRREQKKDK